MGLAILTFISRLRSRNNTLAVVILAVALLVATSSQHASAMPMQSHLYAADGSVVTIACERGGPNCLPTDPLAPVKCGGPGNPCVIDGGPDCQNASSCGTDDTGHNNLNGASNMPGVISDTKSPSGGGTAPSVGGTAPKPAGGETMKAQ